ncbi:Hypothetical predicted protein [Mytilus galloprovincialis]|uniref:Uncharacterized protein n=1 Tax=Mytilus galloprovincialis TaxID=29158 RepID=A0A8B6HQT7_MYTGA|nr:Hypothetical predicted protein [Mytilus galloprovincialis]
MPLNRPDKDSSDIILKYVTKILYGKKDVDSCSIFPPKVTFILAVVTNGRHLGCLGKCELAMSSAVVISCYLTAEKLSKASRSIFSVWKWKQDLTADKLSKASRSQDFFPFGSGNRCQGLRSTTPEAE